MKKHLLTILLTSLSSVLFAQWTTPTTGTTTTNDKIGIGTTSPVSKVEVVGNMGSTPILKLFNTDNVDGRSSILFQSNKPSLQGWEFGENVGGGTNTFGLRDITSSGSPIRFVVNTNGYFGIGTSLPSATLDVNGFISAGTNSGNLDGRNLSFLQNSARLLIGWNRTSGEGETSFLSNQGPGGSGGYAFYDYNNNGVQTQLLRIKGNGNVGIGTSSPQSILDVKGSPNFKGDVVLYGDVNGGQSNTASPNLIFQGTNYAGATMLAAPLEDTYGRRGFAVYTHSDASDTRNLVERLRISNTGNVLIGKTSQSNNAYKLDVAGSVRANAIVVNTTGADFVFENNYKLCPLSEVESFVKANHHLPEIPSADQMKEQGMDVGELNKRLLQKVEELTLYLIDNRNQLIGERIINKKQEIEIGRMKKELNLLKATKLK